MITGKWCFTKGPPRRRLPRHENLRTEQTRCSERRDSASGPCRTVTAMDELPKPLLPHQFAVRVPSGEYGGQPVFFALFVFFCGHFKFFFQKWVSLA